MPGMEMDITGLDKEARDYRWISTDAELADYCKQWLKEPLIALDTEFQRTDTFYPIAGLIQVAVKTDCFLIDPLAIEDFSPLIELFQAPDVLKVLHACSEDLELFAHQFGVVPLPLFDTQVACSFIGLGLSIGYQRLLQQEFGIELDKEETRSDWLQRPLTDAQKHYAALDVVYLEQVYQWIAKQLREQDKYPWVLQECERLAQAQLQTEDYQLSYLQRFKQGWKLRPQQLAVLQSLSAWREDQARERDMPRNFLLHNNSIMAIAQRPPRNMRELSKVERIRGKLLQTDGRQLLSLIQEAVELPDEQCPMAPPRPLPPQTTKLSKQLKAEVNKIAEAQGLAPELLLKRKDLEAMIRDSQQGVFALPEGLQGWREALLAEPLLNILKQTTPQQA